MIVTLSAFAPPCASALCDHVATFPPPAPPVGARSQQPTPDAVRPSSSPGFCSTFGGGGGGGSAITWRTVRTDTSAAGCACSQSSSASKSSGRIPLDPQPLSQKLWSVKTIQPPPAATARVT